MSIDARTRFVRLDGPAPPGSTGSSFGTSTSTR